MESILPTDSGVTDRSTIVPRLRHISWFGMLGLLAVALTFLFSYWVNTRSNQLVQESQVRGRLARESRLLTLEREKSIRGYLLSKQQVSLIPGLISRDALQSKLDSLVRLTSGHASQQDRAKAIGLAISRWDRGWVTPILAAGGSRPPDAESDLAGKELFDSISEAFDSFVAGQQRTYQSVMAMQSTLQIVTLAAVVVEIILLIVLVQWLSRRSIGQARKLIEQQDQLEIQTGELQQQAAELEEQTNEANEAVTLLSQTNSQLEETIRRLESAESIATSATTQHQDTRELLDFVLNSSPVGVSLRDSNLRLVRVNAALTAMTGMSAAELSGKNVDEIMSDDVADVIEPALRRVIATGQPITNIPLSGATRSEPKRVRHYLASFFPVKLPGGEIGAGTVVLETTQYRQLEDQLLQAHKMEAVGRLAGGVAHDFNNMLTAIMSYGELVLADLPEDSLQRSDVLEILKAGEKATGLTRKLLAFSRQQVLRPTVINLNGTIDGMRNMLTRMTSANMDLSFNFAPDLGEVTADATEIERVIVNLVLNSRDAMVDGGKLIIETANIVIDDEYCAAHADTRPGAYVMISVTDTGPGMSNEVKQKLFEPFFTTKEKGKGTGLGLPSVYGIVKQSGGFVWVYSEPGRGTTFKIYLPRTEQGLPASKLGPVRPSYSGAQTILIVDDDEEVRNVATRILRQNGYKVIEAANGAEALRVCDEENTAVDLIVTDIVMPEMGGPEFAERLRETQPDARILFTSGYTENAATRQNFLDPDEAFIEKPFTPASLALKARQVLDSTKP